MDPISGAEMRKIEQEAIASGRVTGLDLMERAGCGVVEAIFEEWPELQGTEWGPAPTPPEFNGPSEEGARRAVVLCGPGNNGGDGFVVARLLAERGWAVDVFFYGDAERLPPDAKANFQRWKRFGKVYRYPSNLHVEVLKDAYAVVVDAVFGIGANRPLDAKLFNTLSVMHVSMKGKQRNRRLIAVDVPTGMNSETGMPLGEDELELSGFSADLTVTFHRPKHGHTQNHADEYCGKLVVKDIGL